MDIVRWKLKDFLEQHDLSVYALVRASNLAPNTVYSLARGSTHHVRLDTVAGVLGGLRQLTGQNVGLEDVLEHEVTPEHEEMDEETRVWLDAALTPPLEPWEWGPEGEPEGVPVRYVPGQGWLMYEDDA